MHTKAHNIKIGSLLSRVRKKNLLTSDEMKLLKDHYIECGKIEFKNQYAKKDTRDYIGYDGESYLVNDEDSSYRELYCLLKSIMDENINDLCLYHREWALQAVNRAENIAGFAYIPIPERVQATKKNQKAKKVKKVK